MNQAADVPQGIGIWRSPRAVPKEGGPASEPKEREGEVTTIQVVANDVVSLSVRSVARDLISSRPNRIMRRAG